METEKREAYVDKKITWHRGKCGGTDSGYVCDSDDCSAVSPQANGGRACERDDYAFFHDVAGVLCGRRGIQPDERPGAYVFGGRTVQIRGKDEENYAPRVEKKRKKIPP